MVKIIHSDFPMFSGSEFLEFEIFTYMLNNSLKTEI